MLASATDERGRAAADDAVQRRIQWLIGCRLVLVASAAEGWDRFYRAPRTGILWEATNPNSELLGRGPLRLARIGAAEAREK